MSSARGGEAESSDAGFSMVELLVYMVLSVLAMAVVGTIMINGMRAQRSVQSIGTATSTASIISRSIASGIGNAAGVGAASPFAVGAATATGQLLQARTARSTTAGVPTWVCRSWYYSNTNHTLYTSSSTTGAVAAPADTAALSSWTVLGTNVTAPSQTAFAPVQDASGSTTLLKITLTVTSVAGPVVISTTQHATQSDSTGTPTSCTS